ncbi:lipoyl(octanoyl) transferase LipB [Notoacmeibacter ruber]|uniref:Octanoyltransferase n=1 Tax=Notoacmeibacter ruber TaxID=2670375 RepID=A0A3L7JBB3_9HYPH|nr:lipoyl(octanoyl) transferase LipB [Notoacmeibacter ruber]RLQ87933.1 lipoyl(octanoyl) transferase LipB [Notoacmeibacter ruber]
MKRDEIAVDFKPHETAEAVAWRVQPGLTDYEFAVERMERLASEIANGTGQEEAWLVEHPPLFTAGTSAQTDDLLWSDRFPVYKAARGGQYTYHGPGQRVAYLMLDLKRRTPDVRAFVAALEQWIINALAEFGLRGERRDDRVGVWIVRPDKPPLPDGSPAEDKIAAIGIRLRRWVSFHGIAINVEPDLSHYAGINPCGITHHGVTSLVDLGLPVTIDDLDIALKKTFVSLFGEVESVPACPVSELPQ